MTNLQWTGSSENIEVQNTSICCVGQDCGVTRQDFYFCIKTSKKSQKIQQCRRCRCIDGGHFLRGIHTQEHHCHLHQSVDKRKPISHINYTCCKNRTTAHYQNIWGWLKSNFDPTPFQKQDILHQNGTFVKVSTEHLHSIQQQHSIQGNRCTPKSSTQNSLIRQVEYILLAYDTTRILINLAIV